MARMTLSSHQRPVRGETNVWLTPPEIVLALGAFDLDPCAAVGQPWRTAARQLTIDDDGLTQPWDGFVWCNPPFGPDAEAWLDRLADHGNGIGLVPARTETRWYVRTVWERADAVLFLHGRPHFHLPSGERGKANSGAPICLIGYGELAVARLAASGLRGSLVQRWFSLGVPTGRTGEDSLDAERDHTGGGMPVAARPPTPTPTSHYMIAELDEIDGAAS